MKRFIIGGSCALVALMLLLGAASISYTEYQYNIDVATNLTVHGQISCDGRILGDIVAGTNSISGGGFATQGATNANLTGGLTLDNLRATNGVTVLSTLSSYALSSTNLVFQRTRVIRQALTHAGGTVTLNMATNVPGYSVLTLTGAVTFASSGLVDGSQYDLLFFSSGASNSITWGPEFRFPSFKPSYISATNSAGQATIGRLWCEAYGTNIVATYAEEQ